MLLSKRPVFWTRVHDENHVTLGMHLDDYEKTTMPERKDRDHDVKCFSMWREWMDENLMVHRENNDVNSGVSPPPPSEGGNQECTNTCSHLKNLRDP